MSASTMCNNVKVKSLLGSDIELRSALPPMLDTRAAADVMGVSPRTVTRMCEQGKLKAVRVMSLWRISRDALLEFAGLN